MARHADQRCNRYPLHQRQHSSCPVPLTKIEEELHRLKAYISSPVDERFHLPTQIGRRGVCDSLVDACNQSWNTAPEGVVKLRCHGASAVNMKVGHQGVPDNEAGMKANP